MNEGCLRLWEHGKALEGEPCNMKDRECEVEEVDDSAVVRFAGEALVPPVIT